MTPTLPYLQEKFSYYNALCFDGRLPSIPILLSKAKTFLGRLEYRRRRGLLGRETYCDARIRISTRYDRTDAETDDVLIHEMIHLYILVKGIKDTSTHGQRFRQIMTDVNTRFNRNIRISHKYFDKLSNHLAASDDNKKGKMHYVGLSKLVDGNVGVTVAGRNVRMIARLLPARYRIVETRWYLTDDPFFADYPVSRKGTIYKIKPQDMLIHFRGLEEIEL